MLPKGLYYTAKQLSMRALIKPVTARRWLQHGVGQGYLDVKESGVTKRYKVKENVRTSSKSESQVDVETVRGEVSKDVRGTPGTVPDRAKQSEGTVTRKRSSVLREQSTVSGEENS